MQNCTILIASEQTYRNQTSKDGNDKLCLSILGWEDDYQKNFVQSILSAHNSAVVVGFNDTVVMLTLLQ